MVVHKRTMGVIDTIWLGDHVRFGNARYPRTKRATLKLLSLHFPDFPVDEYWEVSGSSRIGILLSMYYPNVTPVVGKNGELLDVKVQRETDEESAADAPGCRPRASRGKGAANALPWLRELLESE